MINKEAGKRYIGPNGYGWENENAHEASLRKYWTARATKKNARIIAEGYAARQIQDTLQKAGKVKTKL